MKIETTQRGFDYAEFKDSYGVKCSLQKSSSAMVDRIWFGIDDVNPIIMAVDAIGLGLSTGGEKTGWVPFKIPDEVQLSARMHLSQDDLFELMPALTEFLDTGDLEGGYDYDFPKEYESFDDDYEMVDFTAMANDLNNEAVRITKSLNRMGERAEKLVLYLDKIKLASENLNKFVNEKK